MDNNDSNFIEWELINKSLRDGFINLSDNETKNNFFLALTLF